jgi:hypothetical protein
LGEDSRLFEAVKLVLADLGASLIDEEWGSRAQLS